MTLRLAHISDSHFDARGDLEDVVRVHSEFVRQIWDARVDTVLHAGDFFDRESSPMEREALADFLVEAAAGRIVYGVKGNHDAPRDVALFRHLPGKIRIFEFPMAEPRCYEQDLVVYPLPWFDKAHVAAAMGADIDQNKTRAATLDEARALLAGYGAQARKWAQKGAATVLLGHVMVQGSAVASGQVLMGTTVELSPMDLRTSGCAYIACGHVHRHQAWEAPGQAPVVYSGSPTRHDHGEPEDKGWVLVEFDGPHLVSWEFRKLPARELYHVDLDARDPEVMAALRAGNFPGFDAARAARAHVRIRCTVRAEDLPSLDRERLAREARDARAHTVKVEARVEAESAPRAIEVSRAQTVAQKVQAYLEVKGLSGRWERVAPLLAELEAQP